MSTVQSEQNIKAALFEINEYMKHQQSRVALKARVDQLTAILDAIISETEPGDNGELYVRIGGGLRRLPDDMCQALNAAKHILSNT